ncbi:MAG: DUF1961 family protein [Verrucomicrobiota bacterium JB024]|nr:DUF1961 family protein [Verrucomicrobiota bacterium JB024]
MCLSLGLEAIPSLTPTSATPETIIVLAGDSTVTGKSGSNDQAGWGWALQQMVKPGTEVINKAMGGRSSLSFRTEGRWDDVLAQHPDWVFIQFGHNDQKGKGPERESDPQTTYRDHLRQYISEVRANGAQPILVTPVCRRTFKPGGQLADSLEPYAQATRIVAREADVPCLDLHAYSYEKFTAMGPEACDKLGPPDKPEDHTHFSTSGSRVIADWVLTLLQAQVPSLAAHFEIPHPVSSQPLIDIATPSAEGTAFDSIPGPYPGGTGSRLPQGEQTLDFDIVPSQPIPQGTLSAWVYLPGPLMSGPHNTAWKAVLLQAPGVFEISVNMSPQCLGFYFNWRGQQRDGGYLRCLIPGMPGPGWHHIAATWDVQAGKHNLYIDGTPAIAEEVRSFESLPAPAPESLRVNIGTIGLAGIKLEARSCSAEDLRGSIGQLYRGASDSLLGALPLGQLSLDPQELDLIYQDDLKQAPAAETWKLEGPGQLDFSPQGLTMKSTDPDGKMGHFVYWLDKPLPADFVAEWNVQILSEYGLNIVFFSASAPGGASIFDPALDPRDGDFSQYHSGDFSCYHISYYADAPFAPGRGTSNLRKNSGFYLVSNGPAGIGPDSHTVHRVTLVKRGPHIQLAVDGQLCIDWRDNGQSYGPALQGGWFGLRQMQWTEARYTNLRIYALQAER